MSSIPKAHIPNYHPDSNSVKPRVDDTGGWVYDNDPKDKTFGSLWVNCTHTTTKGKSWTSY
jgi:hypothetical protein